MRSARPLALAVLAATLVPACGGSGDQNTTSAVDVVTLTIYGATTTYRDDAAGVSIFAATGQSGNTVVTLIASGGGAGVNVQLALPAGATGTSVSGTLTTIVGGHSCNGPVTVNVTKHGLTLGGEVAGSFGPTSVSCTSAPSPSTVSASFSTTHL